MRESKTQTFKNIEETRETFIIVKERERDRETRETKTKRETKTW